MRIVHYRKDRLPDRTWYATNWGSKNAMQTCSASGCSLKAIYMVIDDRQIRSLCEAHAINIIVKNIDKMENGILGLPTTLANYFIKLLPHLVPSGRGHEVERRTHTLA